MAKFSFANRYNRNRLFDIDTEGLEYHNLSDIFGNEDELFTVEAIYINTKGMHIHPCVVASTTHFRGYVNLPSHMTDICENILSDPSAIAAINEGKVGFTIYRYYAENYDNKECYSIHWVDIG